MRILSTVFLFLHFTLSAAFTAHAQPRSLEAVQQETLRPYNGPVEHGADTTTLQGKVLCGYQGWFACEGDGAGRAWHHWARYWRAVPGRGNVRVDLWPDLSELGPDERFPTKIQFADGRPAEVFSSFKNATVLRHFQWMRTAGIDGVLVQRFAGSLRDPAPLRQCNTVLAHCREGANRFGRAYAVEYDLSGLGAGRIDEVIDDWRDLRHRMHLGEDPAYLHHAGRPVVEVWGIGFNDGRKYSLEECRKLVKFLRDDGCCVICGVPVGWRTLGRDTLHDKALLELLRLCQVVSPWSVGRYSSPQAVAPYAARYWKPDMEWCRKNHLEYMPVVFPGFSWHNQHDGPLDEIPRLKGRFLWRQFCQAKLCGAAMLNVAMFDELDEGTAIFKCTNDVPTGSDLKFLTYEGLPSDYYLKLVGLGTRLLRGQAAETDGPREPPPVVVAKAADSRQLPRVFSLDPQVLAANRAAIRKGDPALKPALDRLRHDADKALKAGPYSVMQKTIVPPSGDKHDYLSYAPYYWPDPKKNDGKASVHRDGEVNPDSRKGTDSPALGHMASAVQTLALAYYLTGDERYAARAALLLRTWFIDPATRMNPHLRYGQGVPGLYEGRPFGIVDTSGLIGVADAAGLLESSSVWTPADRKALAAWCRDYIQWLRTSDLGRKEGAGTNNHGCWYDAQLCALALYCGQTDLAREVLAACKHQRIDRQIQPDGSQPRELARTKSFGYTIYNLRALCTLAHLGDRVDVDLWHYRSGDGRSLGKAVDYVLPYADAKNKWPHPELHFKRGDLLGLVEQARPLLEEKRFKALLGQFPADDVRRSRGRLLYGG